MNHKIYIPLTLFLTYITLGWAGMITEQDSLSVEIEGKSSTTSQFNNKTSYNGNDVEILITYVHQFRKNIQSRCAIKGNMKSFRPSIEDGYLNWNKREFSVTGGYQKNRYGKYRLYRSKTVYDPLGNSYPLWNSSGYGLSLKRKFNNSSSISSSILLNNHKYGTAQVIYNFYGKNYQSNIIAGLKTNTSEKYDNCWTFGSDFYYYWKKIRIHSIIKIDYSTGNNYLGNKTKDPSSQVMEYTEFRIKTKSKIYLTIMTYSKTKQKKENYKSKKQGFLVEITPKHWIGLGGGNELYRKDQKKTDTSIFFISIKPIRHFLFAIDYKVKNKQNEPNPKTLKGSMEIKF